MLSFLYIYIYIYTFITLFLTFICPCVANIFAGYNQHDATFHNLFNSVGRSACFRRFFRPLSGAQNCTYSDRYWPDKFLTLYVQFWAPDDGQKNRLKHVERPTEINTFESLHLVGCTLRTLVLQVFSMPILQSTCPGLKTHTYVCLFEKLCK